MRRTVVAALAAWGVAGTASAQAPETWVYAGMKGGAMGWEASSVRRDPAADTAGAWRFVYFTEPRHGEKQDISWALQAIEFDCTANTFRLGSGAVFNKGRRGRIDQPGSYETLEVRAQTPESVLKQVLCDNAVLTGALRASSMADAMDGAERAAIP